MSLVNLIFLNQPNAGYTHLHAFDLRQFYQFTPKILLQLLIKGISKAAITYKKTNTTRQIRNHNI